MREPKDKNTTKQTRKKKHGCKTTILVLKNIPMNLKCFFKAYCAKRGQNMNDVLSVFMKDCVYGTNLSKPPQQSEVEED
jgi:hypothetical protein